MSWVTVAVYYATVVGGVVYLAVAGHPVVSVILLLIGFSVSWKTGK